MNLNELNYKEELFLNENIVFENYGTTGIKDAIKINIEGVLYYNAGDELVLEGLISGVLVLEDAVDLTDYYLEISIEIDDVINVKNNYFNIKDYVWKNIVLELPIKVTKH